MSVYGFAHTWMHVFVCLCIISYIYLEEFTKIHLKLSNVQWSDCVCMYGCVWELKVYAFVSVYVLGWFEAIMTELYLPKRLYPNDIFASGGLLPNQMATRPITKLMQSDAKCAASVIMAKLPAM